MPRATTSVATWLAGAESLLFDERIVLAAGMLDLAETNRGADAVAVAAARGRALHH